MLRKATSLGLLASGALLNACGGGADSAPVAVPPPTPPVLLALTTANYQQALEFSLQAANAGFAYAKLGADVADELLNSPLNLFPNFPCPLSGTASLELTDRNRNGALNVSDTLHIRMDHCATGPEVLTGVMRVEIVAAAPLSNGREFVLNVEVINLSVQSSVPNVPTSTIDFAGAVNFTRTADLDHYILNFGEYESRVSGQVRSISNLLVDYLQHYDTASYDYLVRGTVSGTELQGEVTVNTPVPFTGTIGSFPIAGRLSLSGGANSTARLAEEGAATSDSTAVLVSVDSNGDGAADAEVPQFSWAQLMPRAVFDSLRDQLATVTLPVP